MAPAFLGFVLVAFSMYPSSTSALKILGITAVCSPSHHIWFTEFMRGLAQNGHEIYALSVQPTEFGEDGATENRTQSYVFEGVLDGFQKAESYDPLEWSRKNPIEFAWILHEGSRELCKALIATQGAKEVLELVKNTKIDVIVQDLMLSQCFYGLWEVTLGNPPIVGFTPYGSPNWLRDIVGGNNWPAIKPFPLYSHMPPLNLWDRILNFIYYEIDDVLRHYYHMPMQQELAEKYIGKKMSRSMDELEKNIGVMLINSYAALDPAIFLPPNAIEVGGLHVRDPKPLPQDIGAFLDGAEHGVIVISLGTNVKTDILGPERLKAIVTALGQLKQRVLWKFDADHLPGKPNNVMIKRWLPQGDVLAHPKVRVLWTHSGLLSTQEAVWRGIPVIGMPFFMDQFANIDLLVKKGVALRLDFEFISTETILERLNTILTNPSFALRMKQLSHEYRDRPMSPIDLAVWHVEYASRHPGAPLATPGRNLSRIQLNLLDVYAVLGLAVLSIFFIFLFLFRALLKLFRPARKAKTA